MATIFDADITKVYKNASESLKAHIKEPEWVQFVKTGSGKERKPANNGWWYTRAASVLRQVYIKGPIGVQKLRVKYGNKKNRGHKPEEFYKASGKIIRDILQQMEKAGLVKAKEKSVHKGKIITSKGKSLLDKAAK